MIQSKGANYIGSIERPRVRSLRTRLTRAVALGSAVLTVLVGVGIGALAVDSGTTQNVTAASAGLGLSCTSVIGGEMDRRSPWGGGPLAARLFQDLDNRTLTLSEVVGSPAWTNYTGVGDGFASDPFVKPYNEVIDSLGLNGGPLDDGTGAGSTETTAGILPTNYSTSWGSVAEKLRAERNTGTCFWEQTFVTGIANGAGLGLANVMQMFVTWVSTSAFNSSFICDPDSPSAGGCIDLVRIIGGRDDAAFQSGGDGGLIGDLTNSIYKPLVLIIVVITALGVAWTGIIKRQFREALTQTVWLIVSFIIGLVLLLNPSMLAKAPMIAANAITGCVIGAFNGQNCFDGTGFTSNTSAAPNITADQGVCISSSTAATPDQTTALAVNSMGCTIWKTFILQNYAKGAFGVNLNQLETRDPDTVAGAAVAANAPNVSPNDFCFSLSTSGSIDSFDGTTLVGDGSNQICNLAVYNILMQVNVAPVGVAAASLPSEYDPAWYDLIVTTASSEKMWPIWANGGQQFAQGFVAVMSVLLGGILIVVAAITALMYYLTAVILLIFAPLFILIGINPGRGKKIMLGWLETILSSILKYLASAVFLLVALALYSAVLGSADPMAALLFVTILSVVLWMYRKELVDTFGRISLGGERLANVMDKQIPIMGASARQLSDKASKMPGAIVGGAIGGAMAGGVKNIGTGMKTAAQNELRSAPGLLGRASQAMERQLRDNKSDFGRDASRAKEAAGRAESVASNADAIANAEELAARGAQEDVTLARQEIAGLEDDLSRNEGGIQSAISERTNAELERGRAEEVLMKLDLSGETTREAVNTTADGAVASGSVSEVLAEFRKLRASIESLGVNETLAMQDGNPTLAAEFRDQRTTEQSRADEIESRNTGSKSDQEAWANGNQEFDRQLKFELSKNSDMLESDGVTLKAYNPYEHIEAGKRVLGATDLVKEADIKITLATASASASSDALNEASGLLATRESMADERSAKTEDARRIAREKRIDAEALSANADAMHKLNSDLGPGALPTVRKTEKMKEEAFEASKKVREAYETLDRIGSGEEVADAFEALENQEQAATQAKERRREEALGNQEQAATQAKESREAARAAELASRAARSENREPSADAAMKEKFAKDAAAAVASDQKRVERLSAIEGTAINGLSLEESTARIEKMKAEATATLAASTKAAEEALVAAKEATKLAEATQAAYKEARAEKSEASREARDDRKTASRASREAKASGREESSISREEARVFEDKKKADGVLTQSDIDKIKIDKTSEGDTTQKALNKLVSIADKLAKAKASASSGGGATIDSLQAQIKEMAKNVESNPNTSAKLVEELERTVARLSKNEEQPKPQGPSGVPTRRPGAPNSGNQPRGE